MKNYLFILLSITLLLHAPQTLCQTDIAQPESAAVPDYTPDLPLPNDQPESVRLPEGVDADGTFHIDTLAQDNLDQNQPQENQGIQTATEEIFVPKPEVLPLENNENRPEEQPSADLNQADNQQGDFSTTQAPPADNQPLEQAAQPQDLPFEAQTQPQPEEFRTEPIDQNINTDVYQAEQPETFQPQTQPENIDQPADQGFLDNQNIDNTQEIDLGQTPLPEAIQEDAQPQEQPEPVETVDQPQDNQFDNANQAATPVDAVIAFEPEGTPVVQPVDSEGRPQSPPENLQPEPVYEPIGEVKDQNPDIAENSQPFQYDANQNVPSDRNQQVFETGAWTEPQPTQPETFGDNNIDQTQTQNLPEETQPTEQREEITTDTFFPEQPQLNQPEPQLQNFEQVPEQAPENIQTFEESQQFAASQASTETQTSFETQSQQEQTSESQQFETQSAAFTPEEQPREYPADSNLGQFEVPQAEVGPIDEDTDDTWDESTQTTDQLPQDQAPLTQDVANQDQNQPIENVDAAQPTEGDQLPADQQINADNTLPAQENLGDNQSGDDLTPGFVPPTNESIDYPEQDAQPDQFNQADSANAEQFPVEQNQGTQEGFNQQEQQDFATTPSTPENLDDLRNQWTGDQTSQDDASTEFDQQNFQENPEQLNQGATNQLPESTEDTGVNQAPAEQQPENFNQQQENFNQEGDNQLPETSEDNGLSQAPTDQQFIDSQLPETSEDNGQNQQTDDFNQQNQEPFTQDASTQLPETSEDNGDDSVYSVTQLPADQQFDQTNQNENVQPDQTEQFPQENQNFPENQFPEPTQESFGQTQEPQTQPFDQAFQGQDAQPDQAEQFPQGTETPSELPTEPIQMPTAEHEGTVLPGYETPYEHGNYSFTGENQQPIQQSENIGEATPASESTRRHKPQHRPEPTSAPEEQRTPYHQIDESRSAPEATGREERAVAIPEKGGEESDLAVLFYVFLGFLFLGVFTVGGFSLHYRHHIGKYNVAPFERPSYLPAWLFPTPSKKNVVGYAQMHGHELSRVGADLEDDAEI